MLHLDVQRRLCPAVLIPRYVAEIPHIRVVSEIWRWVISHVIVRIITLRTYVVHWIVVSLKIVLTILAIRTYTLGTLPYMLLCPMWTTYIPLGYM